MLTKNEELFYRFLAGQITGKEYLIQMVLNKKPWQTKKWGLIREIMLKDACEQCGDTTALTLSHDWHPENFAQTYSRLKAEADPDYPQKFEAYVNLFRFPEGFRRPGLKTFRPEPTETDLYVLSLDFQYSEYWESDTESEEARKAIIEQYLQTQRYWSMADTRTLCRKCAYALDKRLRNIP